jgi:DNA-binding SARP family transcriptional activator
MEFRILGPLEVVDGDRQVAIAGSKQRALLAILLLHSNAVVSRDRLIDELWGESPPDTASTALQVHVSQLRKSLGRDVIVTRTPGYMIRVEAGELDLQRFEQLVEEARGKEAAPAAATLRDALRLWRGPPLADLDGSVALPERGQLEEQRLSALEHRIDAELELGLHSQQLPELEALVREDPLRERCRAQLMLALYRSGRQAEALDVYSRGRRLLADELGLEPEANSYEKATPTNEDEYRRKVRMFEHCWAIVAEGKMLRRLRPLYLVEVLSHRHLRYASGVLHLILLGTNIALVGHGTVYSVTLGLQLGLLLAALVGVGVARYYVLVTWATVVALWNYVRRGVPTTWEVAEGTR